MLGKGTGTDVVRISGPFSLRDLVLALDSLLRGSSARFLRSPGVRSRKAEVSCRWVVFLGLGQCFEFHIVFTRLVG